MTISRILYGERSLALIKAQRMVDQCRDKEQDALDALADATASGDVDRIRLAAEHLTDRKNFYDYAILDQAQTIRQTPEFWDDVPALTDSQAHTILSEKKSA
jgi:hypothetical protein